LDTDDADSLAARILVQEHRIYPQAVQWIAEGQVEILDENRTRLSQTLAEAVAETGALLSPTLKP